MSEKVNIATKSQGFTLIELMVTLTVAAIVIGLAAPSFNGLIQRSRSTGEFNRFLGDIVFARSEAVKRSQAVVMCPTIDQSSCSGTNWDGGWLAFVDLDNDQTVDLADGEEIVRVGMSTKGNVDIASTDFVSSGSLSFSGDGKLEDGVAADIGRFVFCDDSGAQSAKGLTFSPFGQHRQMRDTDDDGVIDYQDGGTTNVTCPP